MARPDAVAYCNCFIGGTDQICANIGAYRIVFCGNKWWWPTFTWLCNVAMSNSWPLMRSAGYNIIQPKFRRQIAQSHLTRRDELKGIGRRRTSNARHVAFCSARSDKVAHFLVHYLMANDVGALETIATARSAHSALNMILACAFQASNHVILNKCVTNL